LNAAAVIIPVVFMLVSVPTPAPPLPPAISTVTNLEVELYVILFPEPAKFIPSR